MKICQVGQAAQLRRYLARQAVVAKVKPGQAGQVAQLRRYLARQAVAAKVKPLQAGQVAQFRRDLARQAVVAKVKPGQAGQVAQLRRNLARQAVVVKDQARYSSLIIRRDAVPIPQRHIGQPVVLRVPIRAGGRIVQGLQDVAIRQRRAFDAVARVRRYRL